MPAPTRTSRTGRPSRRPAGLGAPQPQELPSVFPILLRTATHHLSNIRKGKAGLAVVLDRRISEIMYDLTPDLPRHLALEDQGRFAVGYYHQTREIFTPKNQQDPDATLSEQEA